MAYIAPNSTVKILRSISIDNSYRNTILQSDKSSQFSMFNAYTKYSLTNYSYQRVNKGAIRVEILADNLYDCNYMLFQNTAYGNKWFYAFITNVNYINDNTSEIEYQIDVMQTWYFDYDLGECYVAREHTLTDNIGEHLIPEDISFGDFIVQESEKFVFPDDMGVVSGYSKFTLIILYVPNNGMIDSFTYGVSETNINYHTFTQGSAFVGYTVNGAYTGCNYVDIDLSNIYASAVIYSVLQIIARELQGTVVGMFEVPTVAWLSGGHKSYYANSPNFNNHIDGDKRAQYQKRFSQPTAFKNPNGSTYTPKNKKLYTAQYSNIVVSSNEGDNVTYNWELSQNNNSNGTKDIVFMLDCVCMPNAFVMLYPWLYRGVASDIENSVNLARFPTPSWSEDSYAQWWGQNETKFNYALTSKMIGTLTNGVSSLPRGDYSASEWGHIGGAMVKNVIGQTAMDLLSASVELDGQKRVPDSYNGQSTTSLSLLSYNNRFGFTIYKMGITADSAKAIDDYFSLYGYACKEVKTPNVKNIIIPHSSLRPYWNYVKTVGCNVRPAGWSSGNPVGLPQDAMNLIADIYDNGITFWDHLVRVGNYSLINSARG